MKTFKQFLEQKLYKEMDMPPANPPAIVKQADFKGSYLPKHDKYANEKTFKTGANVNTEMNKYKDDITSFLKEAGAKDNKAIENIAEDIVQDLVELDPSGESLKKISYLKGHQEVKAKGIFQIDSPFESLDRSIEFIKNLYLKNHPERNATWNKIDGDINIKSLQDLNNN